MAGASSRTTEAYEVRERSRASADEMTTGVQTVAEGDQVIRKTGGVD